MTTETCSYSDSLLLHNFVHNSEHIWPNLPRHSILLDYVKTLEIELQKRRLVHSGALDSFNPLWFLAQTERDIYLWRQGRSITHQRDFEFWVDLPALIDKRHEQLEMADAGNPFTNPEWGLLERTPALDTSRESEYLRSLSAALNKISYHAHILSRMVSLVRREVTNGISKPVIVLPWPPRDSGQESHSDTDNG